MRTRSLYTLSAIIVLPLGLIDPALAQTNEAPPAREAGAAAVLFSCRAIADDRLRLECFDREVGALQEAESSDEVVIVNQEVISKARRDLFGFALPKIDLFSGKGKAEVIEEITQFEDNLASFRLDPAGRALITLSNGARWMQTDNLPVLGEPKPMTRSESRAPRSADTRPAARVAARFASSV